MKIRGLEFREYQNKIFETSKDGNTLVVLPTGLGKTACALLLAVERLNKHPGSKVLLVSPTKPLCGQHLKTFQKHLETDKKISLLTGEINPSERVNLYQDSSIILATPQTIQSDIKNNRVSLDNFSLLVIDEAHRSRQRYANTILAKDYIEVSKFPRILGLTASPGSSKEKINEIKNNLFIDKIEIRTESDPDVKPYIQNKEINWVEVDLPAKYQEVISLIRGAYKDKVSHLRSFGFTKPSSLINKRDLLKLQKEFQQRIKNRDVKAYSGISLIAQAIKLDHASELLETQGINAFRNFIAKLKTETTKASSIILNNRNITKALNLSEKIEEVHPKMENLSSLISKQLKTSPNSHVIVFVNYRLTIDEIMNYLSQFKEVKPVKLIGQKEGLSQKEQMSIIKQFSEGVYNVLITTSIGEEGLDIPNCDIAIFYDNVSTSIRRIQRSGRVGRIKPGKIVFLMTNKTRDVAYYWKSKKDEVKMKKILKGMQEDEEQSDIFSEKFVK